MKQNLNNRRRISFYGSIDEFFLNYVIKFQEHAVQQKCTFNCIENNKILTDSSNILSLSKRNNKVQIVGPGNANCKTCKLYKVFAVIFESIPLYVFMESNSVLKLRDLPKRISLNNTEYCFLCCIFHINGNHFFSVFEINSVQYLVDDMSDKGAKKVEIRKTNNGIDYNLLNVSSALYYSLR